MCVVTADDKLANLIMKSKTPISYNVRRNLGLTDVDNITGIEFKPSSFPDVINLKTAKKQDLIRIFSKWPLEVENYYKKPYIVV